MPSCNKINSDFLVNIVKTINFTYIELSIMLNICKPKQLSLLRCKVVFDQDFLRWPNQTFSTPGRTVNILSLQI